LLSNTEIEREIASILSPLKANLR